MSDADQTAEQIATANWQQANSSLQNLMVREGLYKFVSLEGTEGGMIDQMLVGNFYASFDLYCPYCRMVTPYSIKNAALSNRPTNSRFGESTPKPAIFVLNAVCLRVAHAFSAIFHRTDTRLTKVGQYPSLADIAFGELSSIDKGLDALDRKELGRALGLYAHDAPLGAFVYLRRVFERMILRAHDAHVAAGFDVVEGFASLPMDRRILAIRDQLPSKVVQNSNVFGVLSKGIHELSDEEGRELFPLVKTVVFQMLGEEERLRLAREQEAATDVEFAKVLARLGQKQLPKAIEDKSGSEVE